MKNETPEIAIVVAHDRNRGIGINNELPWPQIKDDMRRFRKLTSGQPVIMGRLTYFSLPEQFRPLPKRPNIVITGNQELVIPDVTIAHSLDEAIKYGVSLNPERVCIIGGGSVYKEALHLVNRLYITVVDGEYKVDTWFPQYEQEFSKVVEVESGSSDGINYRFLTLERP